MFKPLPFEQKYRQTWYVFRVCLLIKNMDSAAIKRPFYTFLMGVMPSA